jgi:hypothetical protein
MLDGPAKRQAMADYNGWANYETWNVALWIQNDEGLYMLAKEIAESKYSRPYQGFVDNMKDCDIHATPDGVSFESRLLNTKELDAMIRELA